MTGMTQLMEDESQYKSKNEEVLSENNINSQNNSVSALNHSFTVNEGVLMDNKLLLQRKQHEQKPHTSTSTNSRSNSSVSPCHFVWKPLPKPILPPSDEFEPVETFVSNAIFSRHDDFHIISKREEDEKGKDKDKNDSQDFIQQEKDYDQMPDETDSSELEIIREKKKTAAAGYRAILDLLNKKDDFPMLSKVFMALRTGSNGDVLTRIANRNERHMQLVNSLFHLDPFKDNNKNTLMDTLLKTRRENDKIDIIDSTKTSDSGDIFDGSMERNEYDSQDDIINHMKKDLKWDVTFRDFDTIEKREALYQPADAYLNLIVALVSANSVFLSPALAAIWRCCTNPRVIIIYPEYDELGDDDEDDEGKENSDQPNDDEDINLQTHQKEKEAKEKLIKQIYLKEFFNARNARLHATLEKILSLVPKGRAEMQGLVARNFPFKLRYLDTHIVYVQQCLTVLQYVPTLHADLLELLIDKCLEIDVEIKIKDGGQVGIDDDNDKDDHNFDQFLADDGTTNGQDKSTKLRLKEEQEQMEREKRKKEEDRVKWFAEKLDSLMFLLFQHLQTYSNFSSGMPRRLYSMVIRAFDSVILTTHRSKFVQFVIFFLCGLDNCALKKLSADTCNNQTQNIPPETPLIDNCSDVTNHKICSSVPANTNHLLPPHPELVAPIELDEEENTKLYREFATKLINHILDPYRATITRQTSACYLASFISRASFICPETACEAVSALLRFAEAYMESFPDEASVRRGQCDGATQRSSFTPTKISQNTSGGGLDFSIGKQKVEMHSLFYTVCQSAFYIMCFRGKECVKYYHDAVDYYHNLAVQRANGSAVSDLNYDDFQNEILLYPDPRYIDIGKERWIRLCSHHLQPLRYCLESVKGEFLLLADKFNLINKDLFDKLVGEDRSITYTSNQSPKSRSSSSFTPKRKGLRSYQWQQLLRRKRKPASGIKTPATLERKRLSEGVGGLGRGSNPLDSFFPFDPYLLRRSHVFVDSFYRNWDPSVTAPEEAVLLDNTLKDNDEAIVSEEDEIEEEDDDESINISDEKDSIVDDDNNKIHLNSDNESEIENENQNRKDTMDSDDEEYDDLVIDNEPRFNSDKIDENKFVNNEIHEHLVRELKRARTLSITDEYW